MDPGVDTRDALLRLRNLRVEFRVPRKRLGVHAEPSYVAVDDVSFEIGRGEIVALVGESGSGKSTIARALVGLVRPASGSIRFEGRELVGLTRRQWKPIREHIQIVFQNPYGSLNRRRTVQDIIGSPLRLHRRLSGAELRREVESVMDEVGLNPGDAGRYPTAFSGGQRQRIAIARAIALRPKLVICDEPLSALDVSVQAQIANLLLRLQEQHGVAYLFIAHDLSVVRNLCDRVVVLYLGRIMEIGGPELYDEPLHPYTQALLAAAPRLERDGRSPLEERLPRGEISAGEAAPIGCCFAPRCPRAKALCRETSPQLRVLGNGRSTACHFPLGDAA